MRFEQDNHQTSGAIFIINQYYTNVRQYSNNSPYKANVIPNEHAAGNKNINSIYDCSKRLSLSLQYTHLEQLFKVVVLTMYVTTYLGKKGGVVKGCGYIVTSGGGWSWPRSQTFYLARIVSDGPDGLRYIYGLGCIHVKAFCMSSKLLTIVYQNLPHHVKVKLCTWYKSA